MSKQKSTAPYTHLKIERKWQKEWQKNKVYQTLSAGKAKKKKLKPCYVLDMFPYPSGAGLHVGHPRGYIASDVFARMKRMQGYNVLHPMGFDSFGLPAEQYAIQTGKHPGPFTEQLVKRYKEQLSILGFSYDWDRQVATHDPDYYRWTQWIFLQIYNSWYDRSKKKARPIDTLIHIFEKSGNEKIDAVCGEETSIFSAKQWKSFSEIEKQNILMQYRLAYEGYAEVNWCAELGTVLANDEVVDGPQGPVSERGGHPVEKRRMRQWFMRITAYADRLLEGLETIDWSNSIKEIQRNWIGKSEGSEIGFAIKDFHTTCKVFTTRADTLFGVTYMVLAPEHTLVQELRPKIANWKAVENYINQVKNTSEVDRTDAKKEKTGIPLEGIVAINPANGEEIPVWIADYVLAGYGTGAVMAVPAHDERDFEFAQKYKLPVKQVIARTSQNELTGEIIRRDGVVGIVQNNKSEVLVLTVKDKHTNEDIYLFPQGGIEKTESPTEAIFREVSEESGYNDISLLNELGVDENYFLMGENQIRHRFTYSYSLKLNSESNVGQNLDEDEDEFGILWMKPEEALKKLNHRNHKVFLERFILREKVCFSDYGVVVNSGKFNGLTSEQARKAITEFVGGKLVTKYKMRDAIFARQRYWGEPIPLVHKKDGTIQSLKDKQLPLKLPNVKSYKPSGTGESPLSGVKSWVAAGHETNTMPGWAGSSWYFLRYMDPKNKKSFIGKDEMDYWGNVDMYVGGADHATGHLLYSRFWHKVLKDLGYVKKEEPFKALRNQGMILGPDSRKMSKRWGNVINPDDVVVNMGADTLRVYECFMGPFESSQPWNTDAIVGSRRFIERVWKAKQKVVPVIKKSSSYSEFEFVLHKTIKKVTEDIYNFSFNTAVSALMILLNEMEKQEEIKITDFKKFVQILAPFVPHMTEEIWQSFGEKKSIHLSSWPTYDPKKMVAETIHIVVQVNGKVRTELCVVQGTNEEEIKAEALKDHAIIPWIENKEVKRVIYVPGRLVNIVV